jgi:hypothetical protein
MDEIAELKVGGWRGEDEEFRWGGLMRVIIGPLWHLWVG